MANSRATWPLGRGFDRWYGFHGGETHQFVPALYHDNHAVRPPRSLRGRLPPQRRPGRPGHRVPGRPARRRRRAALLPVLRHRGLPFAAPRAGRVDRALQGPLRQGLGRTGARRPSPASWRRASSPRAPCSRRAHPGSRAGRAWTSVSARWPSVSWSASPRSCPTPTQQIGRVLDFIEDVGDADDTVVIVVSDNGASSEGGKDGTINEGRLSNFEGAGSARCTAASTRSAGRCSHNNYPWGWTMAGNTPFKRWKREVHEGGVADPCIVRLPAAPCAAPVGGMRSPVCPCRRHPADSARAGGVAPPGEIDGVAQSHLDGTSFAYVLGQDGARRARPAPHPALRDARVARDLPRRLEGGDLPPGRPDLRRRFAATTRPWTTTCGSSTTSPRTSRRPATSPPSSPRRWPSWSRCGGRRRAATTCCPSTTGSSTPSRTSTTTGGPRRPTATSRAARPVPEWVAVDVRNRSHDISVTVEVPEGVDA